MICESNIGLSPHYLRTFYTNSRKVESMSLQVCNIHVGNLLHGFSALLLDMDRSWEVIVHAMFNVEVLGGHVVCESNTGLSPR